MASGEQQYFYLGPRFSNVKMTRYAKNLGRPWPPGFPGYAYGRQSITTSPDMPFVVRNSFNLTPLLSSDGFN